MASFTMVNGMPVPLYGYDPVAEQEQAQREAIQREAIAQDRAQAAQAADEQFTPAASTDGITGGFAGRQSPDGISGVPVPQGAPTASDGLVDPFAGQPPPVAPVPVPMSTSTTTRTHTSESMAGGQSGPVDEPGPEAAEVEPITSDSEAAGPAMIGEPVPPPPAPPPPPPETLEEKQVRLRGEWDRLAGVDVSKMSDPERLQLISRQGEVAGQMKEIAAQHQVEADAQVAQEQAAIQRDAVERQRIADRDLAIQKQAVESDWKLKTAHVDQLDEEERKRPIDRSWGNGSTGSLVMTAISVALAGLGSALKGDGAHNPALDLVLRQIDQRVADQWKKKEATTEWANKARGRLDVYKQSQALSLDEQQQAAKIAMTKRVADEMKQVAATLPAAKRAVLEMTSAQLAEQAVKARQNLDETLYKRSLDERKQAEVERAAKEDEKTRRAGVGAQYARVKLDRDQFEENKTRYYSPEMVDDRAADRDKKRAEIDKLKAEAKSVDAIKALDAQKKALDLAEAEDARNIQAIRPTVVKDPTTGLPVVKDGKLVVSYGTFKQPDHAGGGDVHIKGSEEGKFKVAGAVASYEAAARATDALIKEVSEHGWRSTTLRGDNYKTAQSLYTALMLEGKDTYNLGALQPAEIKMMGGLFGGDPTALIGDPVVSLRAARDLLGQKAFTQFKAHSDYAGSYDDFKLPEDTPQGIRESIQSTPAGALERRAEGRIGNLSGTDARRGLLRENWSADPGSDFGQTPDPRGIPSRDAYDAIQEAADLATGRGTGNPEDGKAALRAIVLTENHGPAWRLAARTAFENNIDLGIDYFNPLAYDAARNSGSVEIQRTLYGTDPTYGYGGTEEGRTKHRKAFGLSSDDAVEILRRVK